MIQQRISVATRGRGTVDVGGLIAEVVRRAPGGHALCNVFVHHTSASLILCENADPTVRADLERFVARLVADGDPIFRHTDEGPDDMSAHVRTVLTQSSLTLPVEDGRLALGTWQGIYLWEHRTAPHTRTLTVSVFGF